LYKIENELDIGGERKPKEYRSKLIKHIGGDFGQVPKCKFHFKKN